MNAVLEMRAADARHLDSVQPPVLQQFESLVTAPDGIACLRELIFTLAIEGRLSARSAQGDSATTLLRRAMAEKERLVGEGLLRAEKRLHIDEVTPFELPQGWEWVTTSDVCVAITDGDHQPPPKAKTGVPFLVIGDIRDGRVHLDTASRYVPQDYYDGLDWTKKPRIGDILYTTVGSFGIPVPVVRDEAFCFQRHIAVLRPALPELQPYLLLALRSSLVLRQAERKATGIAQKTVPLAALRGFRLPLPPLDEQIRIVARVDELMHLCDALEVEGRLEAEQHARLLVTLLHTLVDSSSSEELAANWQRVAAHFDTLFDRPEALDALEETVFRLAVRGLLVPQAESGHSGMRRDTSWSHGKELPFRVPDAWSSATLDELCVIRGGATPSKAAPHYWTGDIPWVSPKDMKVAVISDSQDHISNAALTGPLSMIPAGSLLMVVRGMILARTFPIALTEVAVTINQDMKALTPRDPRMLAFLMLACRGMQREILGLVERSTHGTCKLESPKIFKLPFPLPPLEEQHRIVSRVEQLLVACADLREKLVAARGIQMSLADSLTQSAGQGQA